MYTSKFDQAKSNGCPYQQTMNTNQQQQHDAASPHEALPAILETGSSSELPPQTEQGLKNFLRMRDQGPHVFFARMASRTHKAFFQIKVGFKPVYMITDGTIAEQLLKEYGEHLGRGSLLDPFKSMVGETVFFAHDGPGATKTRQVFLNSVLRVSENFNRIAQVTERSFTSTQLTEKQGIPDLFAFVAWHTIGCIASCFVGTNDLSAIPSDTHITFLKATRQITQATMDPLSRLIHPCLRQEFREASTAMAEIARQLLHSNIDNICKGDNYIWDLAIFRAKELFPERNFDNCPHFDASNPQTQIIREIVEKDAFILEHGPLTIFASANVGSTLFYLIDVLSRRPDIIDNMRTEITRVLGDEPFSYQHMAKLGYVRAVVQEALWQATPIPDFPREVLSPFEASIMGETVSFHKGNLLMFLFRPMQGPSREFSPEKWLDGEEKCSQKLFAFSAGHRRCPAKPFAEQVLTQFLVSMTLHNLHILLTSKAAYTTHNGNLGPDYKPQKPVTAEVHTFIPMEHLRARL